MEDILSKLHVLLIVISVIGRENSSCGHASFKSLKSMHGRTFSFSLCLAFYWLANQDITLHR